MSSRPKTRHGLAATADALAARLPGLASDARGLTAIRTLVKLTAGRVFLALGFAQDLVQHHDLTQPPGIPAIHLELGADWQRFEKPLGSGAGSA